MSGNDDDHNRPKRPHGGGAYRRQADIIPIASLINPRVDEKNKRGAGRKPNMEKRRAIGESYVPDPNPKEAVRRGNGKGSRGLTAKQEAFAIEVAKGSTLSAAYRKSYNTENMADKTVWDSASRLADHPAVAARINQEVERIERERPHDDAATRRLVRDYLVSVVQDAGAKTSDRNRAAELLGKVAGVSLFSQGEKGQSKVPQSRADLDQLLTRLLDTLKEEEVKKAG